LIGGARRVRGVVVVASEAGKIEWGLGESWRCLSLDPLARRAAVGDEVR
jgi:hypothetical protein